MSLAGDISPALDNAVTNAADNGIYFTHSAGNDGENPNNVSPAHVNGSNIYTISAIDNNDSFATSLTMPIPRLIMPPRVWM